VVDLLGSGPSADGLRCWSPQQLEFPDFHAIIGAIGGCFLKCGRVGLLFGMNGINVRGSRSVSSLSRRSKALVLMVSFDCGVDSVKELVCVQLWDLQISPGLRR